MDAVTFIKEYHRMCRTYDLCCGCPLKGRCSILWDTSANPESVEAIVAIVEKWSKEHPLKTNGMVLMEKLERMDVPCVGTAMNELKQKMEIEIDAEWWNAEYKGGVRSDAVVIA